jgi:hypothetical protein
MLAFYKAEQEAVSCYCVYYITAPKQIMREWLQTLRHQLERYRYHHCQMLQAERLIAYASGQVRVGHSRASARTIKCIMRSQYLVMQPQGMSTAATYAQLTAVCMSQSSLGTAFAYHNK